jgi:predicted aldo/keto reductase-like oxidoreductase
MSEEGSMKQRNLGKTGFSVSEIGLGTWQVGGTWGQDFDEALAARILDEAVALGITQKGWYENDSNLDSLRALPRFKTLMDGLSAPSGS